MNFNKTKVYFSGFFLFILCLQSYPQSLTGSSGLLRIPTAKFEDDKTVFVGGSFLNKSLLPFTDYQYNAIAIYSSITFLPFLELGIRYTRKLDLPREEYETKEFADRMPSFKLRILKERKNLPALAIGANDFITSVEGKGPHYFASYYAVITKTITKEKWGAEFSLGHAFKLDNPKHYDILGTFGGARFFLPDHQWFSLMVDYDSRYWNTGVRLFFFNHLQIMPVLRNGNAFEGNISYHINL